MTIQEQFELENAKYFQEIARKECEYWFGKFCYYIPEQCSEEKFKEYILRARQLMYEYQK